MGLLQNCWNIFRAYDPKGWRMILFALALIYLFFTEKDKHKRIMMIYLPVALLVIYFMPPFRWIYLRLIDVETYYRVLWLVPFGLVIAYAACKLCKRWKYLAGVALLALIILCGNYVYDNNVFTKAENAYHLPQTVIDLCDAIIAREGDTDVIATFPPELVYFVRQYDTRIYLSFGRDYVEPTWGYHNDLYDIMASLSINTEKLLNTTRNFQDRTSCYLVLSKYAQLTKPLEEYGVELVTEVGDYKLYYDEIGKQKFIEYFENN